MTDRAQKIETAVAKGVNAVRKNYLPGKDPFAVIAAFAYEAVPSASHDEIVDALEGCLKNAMAIDDSETVTTIAGMFDRSLH